MEDKEKEILRLVKSDASNIIDTRANVRKKVVITGKTVTVT